jgi:hypothetical protein
LNIKQGSRFILKDNTTKDIRISQKDKNQHVVLIGVLDLVNQVHDVVLMNVYLNLGDPGGSGFWNEGYMGKGRGNGKISL